MGKRGLLVAGIVVLIAIGVVLWKQTRVHEAPVVPARSPQSAQEQHVPEGSHAATTTPGSSPQLPSSGSGASSAPGEDMKKIAIKHTSVQRDDGSGTGPFTADTLRAMKDAAAPAIKRCIDESWARNPDFRAQPDIKGHVSVVFTAKAAGGQVTVPAAHVIVNGFDDDHLAECAERTYRNLRVTSPSGQADGEGTVESGYSMN